MMTDRLTSPYLGDDRTPMNDHDTDASYDAYGVFQEVNAIYHCAKHYTAQERAAALPRLKEALTLLTETVLECEQ